MTTIAIKDGVLAVDSGLYMSGNTLVGTVDKYVQFRGGVAAGCGTASAVTSFLKWAKEGAVSTSLGWVQETNFSGVIYRRIDTVPYKGFSYVIELYEQSPLPTIITPIDGVYADGSGAKIALGAMLAGGSAEEAVHIACRLDATTHGPVHAIRLWESAQPVTEPSSNMNAP